ncbi:SMP-30/gluconolactonase/LRE family protein [Rhodococcus sp. NPDC003322]
MTLSRVAMVGAVVAAGVVAGAPLAAAQPSSVAPTSTAPTSTLPVPPLPAAELPVQIPTLPPLPVPSLPALPALPGAEQTTGTAPTTTAAPASSAAPAAPMSAVATTTAAPTTTPVAPPACTTWRVSTVASGFGVLENLAFDGDGGLLLSESPALGEGAIRTLTPSGEKGTLVSGVPSPGGIVVDDDRVVFTTGNNVMAGLYNGTNGTVESVRRDGGDRTTLASGLTMPNGLTRLESGDLLVTHALGREPGLTRVPAGSTDKSETVRSDIGSANGIFTSGSRVYIGNTFEKTTEVRILDAADLDGDVTTVSLPGNGQTNAGDDLTVDADGRVYMALNGAGKVVRLDPATGDSCEIASGLPLTSSVRFGAGPGWDAASLYTTGFDGTVHRLTPPTN